MDNAENIAKDVASRIVNQGLPPRAAFVDIGCWDIYRHSFESDMPNGWATFSEEQMALVLTPAIEKAMRRMRNQSHIAKIIK